MNTLSPAAPAITAPSFSLGRIVGTPGAIDALETSGDAPITFLRRHARGDWGDVCKEDANANDHALIDGTRLFSAYQTSAGEKLWIITEADRSITTLLLPSEY